MEKDKNKHVGTDHEKEIYETQAASSFGVFSLLTIITIVIILLALGFFLLNFMNS